MEDNTCSICLEVINESQMILRCLHAFHKSCFTKYEATKDKCDITCPNCRTKVYDDESSNNDNKYIRNNNYNNFQYENMYDTSNQSYFSLPFLIFLESIFRGHQMVEHETHDFIEEENECICQHINIDNTRHVLDEEEYYMD